MQIQRNPYVNRAMIRTPSQFYGRRREVARLAQRLSADPPQSVAIVGDRRMGKSSLLHHLAHAGVGGGADSDGAGGDGAGGGDPHRTLVLFLDLQAIQRPDPPAFFQLVGEHLQSAAPEVAAAFSPEPDGLRRAVEDLERRGGRLLLLLDEFDRVTRNARFDADFFAALRSLASRHSLALVTSSGRDLQQLCHTQEVADSPFFNIFATLHLGPFDEAEARELITRPTDGTPVSLAPHADAVLSLGGRWPLFLQMACCAAFELLVEEQRFAADAVADASSRRRSRISSSSGNSSTPWPARCATTPPQGGASTGQSPRRRPCTVAATWWTGILSAPPSPSTPVAPTTKKSATSRWRCRPSGRVRWRASWRRRDACRWP